MGGCFQANNILKLYKYEKLTKLELPIILPSAWPWAPKSIQIERFSCCPVALVISHYLYTILAIGSIVV